MADDSRLILVFLEELARAGECYLVDILIDLLLCHTDTAVDNLKGTGLGVSLDVDCQIAEIALELAGRSQSLEFLGGIHRIGDQLANENVAVRIEELFDNREYILGSYSYFSLCHNCYVFIYCFNLSPIPFQNGYQPALCDKLADRVRKNKNIFLQETKK